MKSTPIRKAEENIMLAPGNAALSPEIHQFNPDAVYIPRTGQINAWDNPAWVKAIEATKRKTLLIASTLTSVCMGFLTLSAVAGTAFVPASAAVRAVPTYTVQFIPNP